ncbi:hypothetical protein ACNS7O_05620 [Haloferacaceae archaeon DSL9]
MLRTTLAYHETGSLVAPIVAHNVANGSVAAAALLAAWILAA